LTAELLDGKKTASLVRERIAEEVEELKAEGKGVPGLAVVIVGENPASKVYVGQKEKACKAVGFNSILHRLPEETTQEELLSLVDKMNNDPEIDGILVQLPLPRHMDSDSIIAAIRPEKDVDGFHPINMGKLVTGLKGTEPCTPKGIMYILNEYGVELEGKRAVVLGRSNIVGKPIAHMLMAKNATVTICHSRTKDMANYTRDADVIVAAVGKPKFLTADMVKEGAVIVDVGINRLDSGLVGDVDFEALKEKASFITPVPGGIGPMTIAMLLQNTLEAFRRK
jgi:methylenetetrahydrofolate dehydrogenase (NADP+)/methenyltetrahydrofolate cyclohydrolase